MADVDLYLERGDTAVFECIRASRFVVVFIIGLLVWTELTTAKASVGEITVANLSTVESSNANRPGGVSSRGGSRMIYGSRVDHDILVTNLVYPLPTSTPTPTPIPTAKPTLTPSPTAKINLVHIGQFKITAYSDSPWLNGTDGRGITASGVSTHWGAVAVDPNVIPLGSKLAIDGFDGMVFTALDTGGGVKGAWIDIWFPTDWEAIQWGVRYLNAYLVKE